MTSAFTTSQGLASSASMLGPADGFRTMERRSPDRSLVTEQTLRTGRPIVPFSDAGARALGGGYWVEVTRATRRLLRYRETGEGLELRILGVPPAPTPRVRRGRGRHGARQLHIPNSWRAARPRGGRHHQRVASRSEPDRATGRRRRLPRARRPCLRAAAATARGDQPPILSTPGLGGGGVRIAVLGATGVVGRALVSALAERTT